jgi:hypothetical protein
MTIPTGGAITYTLTNDYAADAVASWRDPDGNLLFSITEAGAVAPAAYPLTGAVNAAVTITSLTTARVTKTASYTLTTTDYAVDVDTTAGAVTITLPASPTNGAQYVITKITTDANVLTIGRNGKKLQGASANVTTASGSYPSYTWQYDSTSGGWWLR